MAPLYENDLFDEKIVQDTILRERFLEPPFSVLSTMGENWQRRKRQWIEKGLKSEEGREGNMLNFSMTILGGTGFSGTSIFDPVLCELCYTWFCPEGGKIIDPFTGGSVRGVVASYLGFDYDGIELRGEQVAANYKNAAEVLPAEMKRPVWINSDSEKATGPQGDERVKKDYDFLFSCPPYMDLEVYSDGPDDLSNMKPADFAAKYERIIAQAGARVKPNRFACFVVGEVRDKKTGFYHDFVQITKEAFKKAGFNFYNDIILLNNAGTAAMRAAKQMNTTRKVVRIHQNVLVFFKGDVDSIRNNYKAF